jgi:hypothetical protein
VGWIRGAILILGTVLTLGLVPVPYAVFFKVKMTVSG